MKFFTAAIVLMSFVGNDFVVAGKNWQYMGGLRRGHSRMSDGRRHFPKKIGGGLLRSKTNHGHLKGKLSHIFKDNQRYLPIVDILGATPGINKENCKGKCLELGLNNQDPNEDCDQACAKLFPEVGLTTDNGLPSSLQGPLQDMEPSAPAADLTTDNGLPSSLQGPLQAIEPSAPADQMEEVPNGGFTTDNGLPSSLQGPPQDMGPSAPIHPDPKAVLGNTLDYEDCMNQCSGLAIGIDPCDTMCDEIHPGHEAGDSYLLSMQAGAGTTWMDCNSFFEGADERDQCINCVDQCNVWYDRCLEDNVETYCAGEWKVTSKVTMCVSKGENKCEGM